jgi:oxygen-independent coproporphyrinogen-3 oxidase
MYHLGHRLLSQMGYESIGMDHFALPGDTLLQAYHQGSLHRNFMGYTTTNHKLVLGLGASSISDTWQAFAQNEKEVEAYQQRIAEGELPLINGHALSPRDMRLRQHILNLMCTDATVLEPDLFSGEWLSSLFANLDEFQADGLLTRDGYSLRVLPAGKLFIRNICSVLDDYLRPGGGAAGAGQTGAMPAAVGQAGAEQVSAGQAIASRDGGGQVSENLPGTNTNLDTPKFSRSI